MIWIGVYFPMPATQSLLPNRLIPIHHSVRSLL